MTSQSPQTGQFNSYSIATIGQKEQKEEGLNPLKRVNSILTITENGNYPIKDYISLNPLKRVNSILTR